MVLHILRALFVLLMAAVGWAYLQLNWLTMACTLSVAVLLVCVDILAPRRKLTLVSGVMFGLVVGVAVAYVLSFVVRLVVDRAADTLPNKTFDGRDKEHLTQGINLVLYIVSCYLSISFVLQTKDDVRLIIPYVEFSKKTKGDRPVLLDTSVLIDGRISDVAATGFIESQLVVPRFILQELQAVADSSDKLKRNRGRRGLDVLATLQENARLDVLIYDQVGRDENVDEPVDQRLMDLGKELGARVLTTDQNLNKVARLRGVDVININDLGNALKPVVLPGETMTVKLVKPGEAAGQGVGYLADGTMVVVEQGRPRVGQEVELVVTSALQTSAGRMIFGRVSKVLETPPRRSTKNDDAQAAPA